MSSNYEYETKGFRILTKVLAPYVVRELQSEYNDRWWKTGVLDSLRDNQKRNLLPAGKDDELVRSLDALCCLQLMDVLWNPIFCHRLTRDHRNWIKELINTRHKWAHKGLQDATDEDAWRALDTMIRLVEQIDPEATEQLRELARTVRYRTEDSSTMPRKVAPEPEMPMTRADTMRSPARMDGDCVIRTVYGLPKGRVVTYGDISVKCYLHPGGGQAVGSAIKAETARDRYGFPWWRVVKRGLFPKDEEARRLLEGEGVRFRNDGSVHPDYKHELQ